MQYVEALLRQLPPFPYAPTALVLILFFIAVASHRIILMPLHNVPGPWYAAISDLWFTFHVLRLRRCRAINDLLTKYGPIVRVTPNRVIFNDINVMKSVYGVRNRLNKSTFYKCLQTNATDHAMTVVEHELHLVRKRGYASHYLPTNLSLFQREIYDTIHELIGVINRTSQTPELRSIDTLLLFRHFLIDINCLHILGYRNHSLKAWEQKLLGRGPFDPLARAMGDFPKRGFLKSILPNWFWCLLELIPIKRWQIFCESDVFLGHFVSERLHAIRVLNTSRVKMVDGEVKSLLTRLMEHSYSIHERMPDADIVSECQGHLIAGTDTLSTTLSYILWEVSRRPDVKARLQEEVFERISNSSEDLSLFMPDFDALRHLPYLDAVIKEGLRLYTAAPSPLERVAPDSLDGNEFSILGYTIPPGTIIASQAWSSHRDPNIFTDPEQFIPERWLSSTTVAESGQDNFLESHQKEMSARMHPFGYGPRVCGGQNLAQILLRVVLVAMVRCFDVVPAEGTDEKSMAIRDSFVIFPAAMECKLIFIPRPTSTPTPPN